MRLGTKLADRVLRPDARSSSTPRRTLAETISPGSEWVEIAGGRKHVLSYLGDFLFPPQRADAPVTTLSGGERNRLLLARLFARPANLLVLDEPTNDLDIESLELLEATLQTYAGTLLLVSHDRAFLDNVVTQTLVAERGTARDVARVRRRLQRLAGAAAAADAAGGDAAALRRRPRTARRRAARRTRRGPARTKLSFEERRELEALPDEIEALEREQHALTERMCRPTTTGRGRSG